MKLLPEQVNKLNESLQNLSRHYISLREEKKSNAVNSNYTSEGFTDLPDNELAYQINDIASEIKKIEALLRSCTIVSETVSDSIVIGSEFTATINFFGEDETETYVLAEIKENVEGKNIISIDSPLGKAVFNKKENNEFSYPVNNNVFTGIIDKIYVKEAKQKTIEK